MNPHRRTLRVFLDEALPPELDIAQIVLDVSAGIGGPVDQAGGRGLLPAIERDEVEIVHEEVVMAVGHEAGRALGIVLVLYLQDHRDESLIIHILLLLHLNLQDPPLESYYHLVPFKLHIPSILLRRQNLTLTIHHFPYPLILVRLHLEDVKVEFILRSEHHSHLSFSSHHQLHFYHKVIKSLVFQQNHTPE